MTDNLPRLTKAQLTALGAAIHADGEIVCAPDAYRDVVRMLELFEDKSLVGRVRSSGMLKPGYIVGMSKGRIGPLRHCPLCGEPAIHGLCTCDRPPNWEPAP